MGIISWIILGSIAGFIGSRLVNNNTRQSFVTNLVLGIVGAIVGGVLANLIGLGGVSGLNIWSLIVATGGSVVALVAYNALNKTSL